MISAGAYLQCRVFTALEGAEVIPLDLTGLLTKLGSCTYTVGKAKTKPSADISFASSPSSAFSPQLPRPPGLPTRAISPQQASHLQICQVCWQHKATHMRGRSLSLWQKVAGWEVCVFSPLNTASFKKLKLYFLTDFSQFVHTKAFKL